MIATTDDSSEEQETLLDSGPPQDKGYAWVILVACFYANFSIYGIVYMFGQLLTDITKEFNQGRATVSLVLTLLMVMQFAFTPVWGFLAAKISYRVVGVIGSILATIGLFTASYSPNLPIMFLTYGFIMGLGGSAIGILADSTVPQWFTKYRGLAYGIAKSGVGLGNLVFPPLIAFLSKKFGWRDGLRIMTVIPLLMIPASFFIIPRVKMVGKKTLELSLFKDTRFIILFIAIVAMAFGYMIPYAHIVADGEDKGMSEFEASFLLAAIGGASAAGRVALGFVADYIGQSRILLASLAFMSVITTAWPWLNTFPLLLAYGILYGFTSGSVITNVAPFVAELFGTENLAVVLGMLWFSWTALGGGPPVAGLIYDSFGSYKVAGAMSSAAFIFSFILLCFIKQTSPKPMKDFEESVKMSEKNLKVTKDSDTVSLIESVTTSSESDI